MVQEIISEVDKKITEDIKWQKSTSIYQKNIAAKSTDAEAIIQSWIRTQDK